MKYDVACGFFVRRDLKLKKKKRKNVGRLLKRNLRLGPVQLTGAFHISACVNIKKSAVCVITTAELQIRIPLAWNLIQLDSKIDWKIDIESKTVSVVSVFVIPQAINCHQWTENPQKIENDNSLS